MNNKLYLLIFMIIGLMSCSRNQKIKYEMGLFINTKIIIPYDEMHKVDRRSSSSGIVNNPKYTLVVFMDTLNCSICEMKTLYQWDEYFESIDAAKRKLQIVVIVAPKKSSNIPKLKNSIRDAGVTFPVYVDVAGSFKQYNPQLPDNQMFHTFLLNESDSVVLVGNPLQNEHIERLFQKTLKEN